MITNPAERAYFVVLNLNMIANPAERILRINKILANQILY